MARDAEKDEMLFGNSPWVLAWIRRATAAERERDEARAEIERLKEDLHLCNGTCDLALKHRDIAEQENARLESELAAAKQEIGRLNAELEEWNEVQT